MPTLNEWMDEQKKLCEKATRGPWSAYHRGKDKIVTIAVDIGDVPIGRIPCVINWPGFDSNGLSVKQNVSNAEFFAASRLSLPKALRIIDALIPMITGDQANVARKAVEAIINEK